jgi:hypothetical protein
MAALAKRLSSMLLTSVMIVGLVAPAASAASYQGDVLALMNAERAAAGLAPVTLYSDLSDDALAWTQYMFETGSLSHNPRLATVTTGWDKLGENVGVGPTVESLHSAFMASSSHRGNILGDYDLVGIAVVEENPTKLWVTVVFMKSLGGESDVVTNDPVPYARQVPAAAVEQSVAATPDSGGPVAGPTVNSGHLVAIVRHSGRPRAI